MALADEDLEGPAAARQLRQLRVHGGRAGDQRGVGARLREGGRQRAQAAAGAQDRHARSQAGAPGAHPALAVCRGGGATAGQAFKAVRVRTPGTRFPNTARAALK